MDMGFVANGVVRGFRHLCEIYFGGLLREADRYSGGERERGKWRKGPVASGRSVVASGGEGVFVVGCVRYLLGHGVQKASRGEHCVMGRGVGRERSDG